MTDIEKYIAKKLTRINHYFALYALTENAQTKKSAFKKLKKKVGIFNNDLEKILKNKI
jgi:hypothetical protein